MEKPPQLLINNSTLGRVTYKQRIRLGFFEGVFSGETSKVVKEAGKAGEEAKQGSYFLFSSCEDWLFIAPDALLFLEN